MLFRAHRLFDGRTPRVFRDWVIEVEDGRILDVGPRSRAASGSDAGEVVDLGDVTLLPGLIDGPPAPGVRRLGRPGGPSPGSR
jgi:imidazolonepropionase-like amidohydrolase